MAYLSLAQDVFDKIVDVQVILLKVTIKYGDEAGNKSARSQQLEGESGRILRLGTTSS